MKKIYLIITGVILLSNCGQKQDESSKKDKQNKELTETINLDFVKTFEGQLNNKLDIVLKITSNNGQITGNYFYKTEGKDIQVKGVIDNQGKITLNEYDKDGNQTGLFIGVMVNNQKIEGDWSKPNGQRKIPFFLIESNTSFESSKNEINSERFQSITGEYEIETENSSKSVKVNFLGKKRFQFEMTVGTASACTGEVSGTGTMDVNGIGKYSGKGCKLLTFNFSENKLIVIEDDCFLHGVSCSFSGTYLKTQ